MWSAIYLGETERPVLPLSHMSVRTPIPTLGRTRERNNRQGPTDCMVNSIERSRGYQMPIEFFDIFMTTRLLFQVTRTLITYHLSLSKCLPLSSQETVELRNRRAKAHVFHTQIQGEPCAFTLSYALTRRTSKVTGPSSFSDLRCSVRCAVLWRHRCSTTKDMWKVHCRPSL